MFTRVLVANRGEIAVRVIRGLRELGIEAVAVFSDPDRDAPHVRLADHALLLDGVRSHATYLHVPKLVEAARAAGAEAVHPGYGFLSEDADFAAAVEAAGLTWIGPPPAAIRAMGDKVAARERMAAAGVPVVPGWHGEVDVHDLAPVRAAAAEIGFPLLVKASAGGGGKGMRRVAGEDGLAAAIESARSEAEKSFGDGRVFLERDLTPARHVEVQVFADHHGRTVSLGERECSIQRRHQKIIEESPSPAVDGALRARMGEAAVRAAEAVGYRNAGTIEFLLDAAGRFYFLEMNTRLQVEHPVTECVTGFDLVQAQLRVAAGEPLPFPDPLPAPRGHAIECRVYAEDPERGFLPGSGRIQVYREPAGPGVRVDSGVRQGSEVGVHYDPLLAKLIVWAETRAGALRRMDCALGQFVLLGVPHNLSFLRRVIRHPEFRAGRIHTRFLDEHPLDSAPVPPPAALAAALALTARPLRPTVPAARTPNPWVDGGGFRM